MSKSWSPEYYATLEKHVSALLPQLSESLPQKTYDWIEELLRAGEYGEAIDVAAASVVAMEKLPNDLGYEVLGVSGIMGLKTDPIVRLRARLGGAESS
jgi:Arc/MetJ-type ribon-helix-helix transcriptional regulator